MFQEFSASIVMPLLRQRDEWLRQSVVSAINQTLPTEVLVVTSMATPESNLTVLRELQGQHPGLRILQRPPGGGFADAINLGFKEAACERVGLLLTDDWLSPEAIEYCLPYSADIVSGGLKAYAEDGVTVLWERISDLSRFNVLQGFQEQASYLHHFLLFRREKVLDVGGVDPNIGLTGADDYDLLWTMLEHGASVQIVSKLVYHYRDHGGQRLTLRDQLEQIRDLRRILEKHAVCAREAEELVAQKARWYGVPCHVAIKDPDWFLKKESGQFLLEEPDTQLEESS